jgi:hypothetical protein
MTKLRLPFAIALAVPCIFAEATPVSAQTTTSVTLTLYAGTKTQGNLTGVSWTRGTLTLEGKKSDGSTMRCYLKSSDNHLLLTLQQRLMTTQVTIDLANQTSMTNFAMALMR